MQKDHEIWSKVGGLKGEFEKPEVLSNLFSNPNFWDRAPN
jgi:hypothetical protein